MPAHLPQLWERVRTSYWFVPTSMILAGIVLAWVAIEVDLGNSTFIPIPGSPFSTDTAFHLNISNGRFRFSPTGGAVYGFNVRG